MEETVFHETVHATLDYKHCDSQEWINAQPSDGEFVTTYAAQNPTVEDQVHEHIPNRLEYLSRIFPPPDKQ